MKRPILAELERDGWEISHTRGGHLRAVHPGAAAPMFVSATPSDHRDAKNTRALARRLVRTAKSYKNDHMNDLQNYSNPPASKEGAN